MPTLITSVAPKPKKRWPLFLLGLLLGVVGPHFVGGGSSPATQAPVVAPASQPSTCQPDAHPAAIDWPFSPAKPPRLV